jgi:hypothetical protein
LVKKPEDYTWSSYKDYMDDRDDDRSLNNLIDVNCQVILKLFSEKYLIARSLYQKYVENYEISADENIQLIEN